MERTKQSIPVAYVPAPRPEPVEPKLDKVAKPKQEPTRTVRNTPPGNIAPKPPETPPEIARKPTPPQAAPPAVQQTELPEGLRWPDEETKKPRPQVAEKKTIVRRTLPSLKELLPPLDWSEPRKDAAIDKDAIPLGSKDPNYISYLSSIKRAIELVWEYPLAALNQGIQGTLMVEFTIVANGSLSGARLIRSSGFTVLDEEALRAVRSAAPFHPIPYWIDKRRLPIVASFEYFDNRLRYTFSPDDDGPNPPAGRPSQP